MTLNAPYLIELVALMRCMFHAKPKSF